MTLDEIERIEHVIAQLRKEESCPAAKIEGHTCDPLITAKWAARELRRIIGPIPKELVIKRITESLQAAMAEEVPSHLRVPDLELRMTLGPLAREKIGYAIRYDISACRSNVFAVCCLRCPPPCNAEPGTACDFVYTTDSGYLGRPCDVCGTPLGADASRKTGPA